MSPALRHGVLLFLVLGAGAWLRLHDLAGRPMHADEANQAVKVGHMLAGEPHRFDPADHHGPTLHYFGWIAAKLRGQRSLAEMDETTVRLVPACFGILGVVLLWQLARPLGPWPALAAAAFLALSPPAVYYSRYFIQETLLAGFTLAAFVCGQRWWRGGGTGWVLGLGVCAGLMQATKASALLFGVCALLALALVGRNRLVALGFRPWLLALSAAAGTAALLYSSFGANWTGLRDAVSTLTPMLGKATGGATEHEKPWWYYPSLLFARIRGGYVWDQTLFTVLALAGGVLAFRTPARLPRFLAISTGLAAVVLSAIPYKTPWILVNLLPALAGLAGFALGRMKPLAAFPAAAAVLLLLGWQTEQAVFKRPADPRNPYAYVHSSPDVRKFAALAEAAPAGPVKVISPEYWPLPWYLRARPEVGYWHEPPEHCDGALVIASAELADAVRSRLQGRYAVSYLGLRPGFVLVIFTPVSD